MGSKKQHKDENNTLMKRLEEKSPETSKEGSNFSQFESQFDFGPQTENLLKANVSEQTLENIKHIFNKTQTISKVADVKHQEIQTQFKELRERLNTSSESLQRMKKGIENIKFSYQNKILEMHRTLAPPDEYYDKEKRPAQTNEEIGKQMDEIRNRIEKIQNRVYAEKEKQETVIQNYKDAFENVSTLLQSIDKGEYSSIKIATEKGN